MEASALRDFGLTDNEARAYVALVRAGRQSAAEIAPRAGVTRGRVYQVLGELARKGLATELPGRPRSFIAIHPRVALEATLKDRQAEMKRAVDSLVTWWDTVQRQGTVALPAIEILARPEQISQHFQQLQDDAREEILVFNKPPYVDRGENTAELRALGRGVCNRGLYERSVLESSHWVADLQALQQHGEEARFVTELPMKAAVFDRQTALMPLAASHDPSQPFTSVIVHDAGLAKTIALAFDHLWLQGDAVEDVAAYGSNHRG